MVTAAQRRGRRSTRVVAIVAVGLLTALAASQVARYLAERVGHGATTPAMAADATVAGRHVALEMLLSRTRGRWFVTTFGPPA